jgi:hypothetical protein
MGKFLTGEPRGFWRFLEESRGIRFQIILGGVNLAVIQTTAVLDKRSAK